jgi:hypothetical protein
MPVLIARFQNPPTGKPFPGHIRPRHGAGAPPCHGGRASRLCRMKRPPDQRKGGSAAQMVSTRGLDCVTTATVFLFFAGTVFLTPQYQRAADRLKTPGPSSFSVPIDFEPDGPLEHTPSGPLYTVKRPLRLLKLSAGEARDELEAGA